MSLRVISQLCRSFHLTPCFPKWFPLRNIYFSAHDPTFTVAPFGHRSAAGAAKYLARGAPPLPRRSPQRHLGLRSARRNRIRPGGYARRDEHRRFVGPRRSGGIVLHRGGNQYLARPENLGANRLRDHRRQRARRGAGGRPVATARRRALLQLDARGDGERGDRHHLQFSQPVHRRARTPISQRRQRERRWRSGRRRDGQRTGGNRFRSAGVRARCVRARRHSVQFRDH